MIAIACALLREASTYAVPPTYAAHEYYYLRTTCTPLLSTKLEPASVKLSIIVTTFSTDIKLSGSSTFSRIYSSNTRVGVLLLSKCFSHLQQFQVNNKKESKLTAANMTQLQREAAVGQQQSPATIHGSETGQRVQRGVVTKRRLHACTPSGRAGGSEPGAL